MPAESIVVSSWTPAGREDSRTFKTPSGNECLVRDLELDDVLDLGLLDKLDTLSGIVQEEHIDRVATGKKSKKAKKTERESAKDFAEMVRDPEKRSDISEVVQSVVKACVLQPELHDPWINDPNEATEDNPDGRRKMSKDERNPDFAYLDYVNFFDQLAIFHEVFGGMERLQQFREEADETVGDVADEPEASVPSV